MELREKWYERNSFKLALAFLINIVFLALMLSLFVPRFETNDDVLMSKFVDGQLSHKSAHIPFINICLGLFLKTVYTLLGDGFNWYSLCQYTVLMLGFTAVTWTLLRRYRLFPALVMTAIMLSAFGVDSYISMNFSKPSCIGTVGGLCLMLYAQRNETGKPLKTPLILGMVLSVMAFVWRFETFFICAGMMAGIGLVALIGIWEEHKSESRKHRATAMLRYAAPFVLVLVIVLVLLGVNHLAWTSEDYKAYYTFDWTRSILIDLEVPPYEAMPETYDALNMDANAVELLANWNFYDTEKFTTESLQAIINARAEFITYPSIGECLGIFLNKCIHGFYIERPMAGFIFMLLLFIACGKRRARDWLGALWLLGGFFAIYMAFIYMDRYLANRVDIGLFMAMAVGFGFLLSPEKLKNEKLLCAIVLAVSLFVGYRSCRDVAKFDSHNTIEDDSREKAAVDTLVADTEHIFFVKYLSINHELYSPLETAPAGYADKILFIGGWSCRHPEIVRVLEENGIENPYRDIIGSDTAYIIDKEIDKTMAYINKYHDPDATAELVEPLSLETGLMIYRILA